MNVALRKFVVGFLALAALLGVYWLYTRTNRTPPIPADLVQPAPVPVAEVNAVPPQGRVGTVFGKVDIDRVERTEFLHRNERNQVDRIFGFEQLLHKEGSQWEITNPYMKLVLPTVQCIVTANRGKVQVETVFSRPMASDAWFSGNVVIHILPVEPNDALECFIHLDDVSFMAAKSLFSSAGAVRFLSRQAQLTGTGMDLIYDEGRSRLELFRIFNLHSLSLRMRELGPIADLTPRQPPSSAAASPGTASREPAPPGAPTPPDDRYQCVFHQNVAIETPGDFIAAKDDLVIDNILWPGAQKRDMMSKPALDPNDPNAAPFPGPNALNTSTSSHTALSSIPPESFDTIVTCDGGFEVTPMNSRLKIEERRQKPEVPAQTAKNNASPSDLANRQRVAARRIHFNVVTTDTMLDGPVEMAFPLDPNGLRGAQAGAKAMPMTIVAQKGVHFRAAANQVLLDGGCKVTLSRSEPNVTYEYVLTAPRLVLDIASDPNGKSNTKKKELAVTVRKLVTDGGPAALRILRRRPDRDPNQFLGWTTLDATQLQYETDPPGSAPPKGAPARGAQFTALGPGAIWMRNYETTNAKADPNQFSLGRPCVARLTNFDTLTYSTVTNRIMAESKTQQLQLDYFPLVNGKPTRYARTVAGHVQALLQEITKGHLELAALTATQGIDYEDEKDGFVGSSLSYDYAQSLVAIRGDAEQPCLLNGAQVDQIDLNLKTGDIKADIVAPGVIQVRR